MSDNSIFSSSLASSLPSGEGGGRGSIDWGKLLKVLIAVLTAIAGSLGVVSCMS